MNQMEFVKVLEEYELKPIRVSESLSRFGALIWHDDSWGISVKCDYEGGQPELTLVLNLSDPNYLQFVAELSRFSPSNIRDIIDKVKRESDAIKAAAISAEGVLGISVFGTDWKFIDHLAR